MRAYILLITELGSEADAVKEIRKIKTVVEAHILGGVYDILVEVSGKSWDDLQNTRKQIRSIEKVRSALMIRIIEEEVE